MKTLGLLLSLAAVGCASDADESTGGDPIEFSNIRVEEITNNRAIVRFTTSVPTTCFVEYGTTEALGAMATDPEMEPGELAIDHNVPIEDLSVGTTYWFQAVGSDALGESATSEMSSFKTAEDEDPAAGLVNVASSEMGASIGDVSSNFGGGGLDSTWGANNLIDGSMSTEWSTGGDGTGAFAVVELGATRTISAVAYRSRKMTDGTSIVTRYHLLVGEQVLGPFDSPDPDQRYFFELDEPIEAATVRFEAVDSTGGNTGGKELELFAAGE